MADNEKVNEIQILLNKALFRLKHIPEWFDDDKAETVENIINTILTAKAGISALRDKSINDMPCGDCSTKTSPCRTINCQYSNSKSA